MIDYATALTMVLERTQRLPAESIALQEAFGRILAEPIVAPWPMPRFDQSAVDGYAVRIVDVATASAAHPIHLPLIRTHRAGDCELSSLSSTSAIKIFTGAPIPSGAVAIIMREFVEEHDDHILVSRPERPGANIRYAGEEYVEGAIVLDAATAITPPVQALLGSLNKLAVSVYQKPRIACIVTGDELLDSGEALQTGKIYDGNSWGLLAALQGLGFTGVQLYRVKDSEADLRNAMREALQTSDVVISAGGVSMGDYDLVRPTALELGVEEVFWQVAVKPGKPLFFGQWRDEKSASASLFLGLPGNPVAVLVIFHQFVRPALLKMMGYVLPEDASTTAMLLAPLRKKVGRLEWVRARTQQIDQRAMVQPSIGQESHMLGGLSRSNCLIEFPAESTHLEPGQEVRIIPLQWSLPQ